MPPCHFKHKFPVEKVRRLHLVGIIVWAILAVGVNASADTTADAKFTIEQPAKWIILRPFERLPKTARHDPTEEQHYLLLDRQFNVSESEKFNHVVRQILNYSGVQNGASLSIDFDPSYQSLAFHWVRVWRGTNCLNRLNQDKIRLVQPERELDQYIFNGTESAVLVLEDVRVGDIVDYAYTLRGANPVFAGKFFTSVPVQLQFPVEHLTTRLLWPGQRRLYTSNYLCSVKPVMVRRPQNVWEFTWDFKDVPAVRPEDSLPGWYDPEPQVQLSEFPNWTAVNQWALQLFQNDTPISPALKQKIEEWRRIGRWDERVLTVLHFLQDEVRYFGIEIGNSSHQPSGASAVFERRFGDCKDKTLLFVTILRALSIDAYPVLVNTGLRRTIADRQPSADLFDHVIALVQFEGRSYWLDPTADHQIGTLANYRPPDYERGLVVHPRTTSLAVIPNADNQSQTTVSEYFQLGGKFQPASLKVVTQAEGRDAEILRHQFATTSRDEIEKYYLHYYSESYPGIKQRQPISFDDDEKRNRIEMTEFYTMETFWEKSANGSSYSCSFYPTMFNTLLKKPVDKERTMPLAVRFPVHYVQHTELMLPEGWPASRQDKNISDPAFRFEKHVRNWGQKVEIDYEYQSLADSVRPEKAAAYIGQLNEASQSLGFGLTWR